MYLCIYVSLLVCLFVCLFVCSFVCSFIFSFACHCMTTSLSFIQLLPVKESVPVISLKHRGRMRPRLAPGNDRRSPVTQLDPSTRYQSAAPRLAWSPLAGYQQKHSSFTAIHRRAVGNPTSQHPKASLRTHKVSSTSAPHGEVAMSCNASTYGRQEEQ